MTSCIYLHIDRLDYELDHLYLALNVDPLAHNGQNGISNIPGNLLISVYTTMSQSHTRSLEVNFV